MAIERTGKAKEHWSRAQELYEQVKKDYSKADNEKAIAEYSEVIKLLPKDAESYSRLAACYIRTGQCEKAIADYNKAISSEPKEAQHYYARCELYLRLDKKKKALADLARAAKVDPGRAGAFYESYNRVNNELARDRYEVDLSSRR